jgi:hypothetical protein
MREQVDGVTALAFRMDGLNLAVGTHSGQSLLYDLRSSRAFLQKDQGYGPPVKNLSWFESRDGSEGANFLSNPSNFLTKTHHKGRKCLDLIKVTA